MAIAYSREWIKTAKSVRPEGARRHEDMNEFDVYEYDIWVQPQSAVHYLRLFHQLPHSPYRLDVQITIQNQNIRIFILLERSFTVINSHNTGRSLRSHTYGICQGISAFTIVRTN